MSIAVVYPHISKSDGASAYLTRLPRIRVAQIVVDYLNHGWSADEICIHYTHLNPAEVHSAMAYYFDHQPEIDAEIEAEQALIAESRKQAPTSAMELRLRVQGLLPHRRCDDESETAMAVRLPRRQEQASMVEAE